MRTVRSCLLGFVCALVPAQQQTLLDLRPLLSDQAGIWPTPEQERDARLQVLTQLLVTWLFADSWKGTVESYPDQGFLMAKGDAARVKALAGALADVRRGVTQSLRLQISLVRMPAHMATRHGLVDGKNKEMKDDEVGVLLREVQTAPGVLVHLPESSSSTLQRFELAVPARFAEARADGSKPKLVVSGQILPVGESASVHLVLAETLLKKDHTGPEPLLSTTLALTVGKGALCTRIVGNHATVLWVRFVAMEPAQPAAVGK